ncbi:hypothetical protein ZIOFF_049333 [Zingiber officinale]|uniref:Uncharacterized protein n=1 Tax=Zingiber officinale TaxID=94328 RepID=A0A8J5FU19_ZINOF|nr:hypothetical protein ZIOFF_049333 [Zingiber officinale]
MVGVPFILDVCSLLSFSKKKSHKPSCLSFKEEFFHTELLLTLMIDNVAVGKELVPHRNNNIGGGASTSNSNNAGEESHGLQHQSKS